MNTERREYWVRWGGQAAGRALMCAALFVALCAGQAGSRPLYDLPESMPRGAMLETLQSEMNAYAIEGSVQEQQQMHAQLEIRLSRRGFYRLWSRPLEMEKNQQAEAWYDAGTDQTVLCVSWPTANGRAQQVWGVSGKLRRSDFLPMD